MAPSPSTACQRLTTGTDGTNAAEERQRRAPLRYSLAMQHHQPDCWGKISQAVLPEIAETVGVSRSSLSREAIEAVRNAAQKG